MQTFSPPKDYKTVDVIDTVTTTIDIEVLQNENLQRQLNIDNFSSQIASLNSQIQIQQDMIAKNNLLITNIKANVTFPPKPILISDPNALNIKP